jgi:hypothetical protein
VPDVVWFQIIAATSMSRDHPKACVLGSHCWINHSVVMMPFGGNPVVANRALPVNSGAEFSAPNRIIDVTF